jgi:hypothetical protein
LQREATSTGGGQNGHFYYRYIDRLLKFPKPRTCFEAGVNVQVLDTVGWAKLCELNSVARRRKELQDLLNKPEADKLAQLREIDLETSVEPFK